MPRIFWLWLAAINVATLLLYGLDKAKARSGGRRLPESTLILPAAAGGLAGAWLGIRLFRHKTRKPRFQLKLAAASAGFLGLWWLLASR